MPWGLRRFQHAEQLHFITFSCYRRQPLLVPQTRALFERALERMRLKYGFFIVGYVVMPEHVHLLVSEPERGELATAIQAIKQSVARRVSGRFWQERYYDFNVWSERKRIEKLRYMIRNPVTRGLVASPEDWEWSSFRHYLSGARRIVEIESQWTARERERTGMLPQVKRNKTPALPKTGVGRGTRRRNNTLKQNESDP
jgi:putative transposase